MKLPEPKRLPSGKWYIQVMVDGKRLGRAFDDPDEASYWAAGIKTRSKEAARSPRSLTVGEAIDRYIESKDSVLSPSTVAGYKRIRKNQLQSLMGVPLRSLTQEKVQRAINAMAKEKSPKTVSNAHGLLTAALAEFYPDLTLRTTLPQKRRYDAAIPTREDLAKLVRAASGAPIELPVTLAIWFGLRASEIRGLTWACVEGGELHVKQAIVDGENGPEVKGTKTYSGDRRIRIPPYIAELLARQPRKDAYVVHMSGQAIYKAFSRLCEKAGTPHYRFHDLRHANASVMLSLGIPDKYAMERMGHATPNMLKTVYQHTMKEKREVVADAVDGYFQELFCEHPDD